MNYLDTRIEFNYDDHCQKLNISPDDLREIILEFEQRGLIRREGYFEGAFITFIS